MLTITYLSHQHLNFQIFQLCERADPESLSPLLEAAVDIVTTVIHAGGMRTRATFLTKDFEYLVSSTAISDAGR